MSVPGNPRGRAASFLLLWLVSACAGAPREASVPGRGTAVPESDAERDERMAWWREARFGLFIHWGLYAVPAGVWKDEDGYGEWIRDSARIPLEEYARFQRQFDPVRYDADAWVALAREAGMRYLVITSKHHDGFALFDSAQTDWDPFSLTKTTRVRVQSFRDGRPASVAAERRFERAEPRQAWYGFSIFDPHDYVEVPGVYRQLHRGDWDRLPDFRSVERVAAEHVASITLAEHQGSEHLALVYRGLLTVPRDDVYTFSLASGDGSALWIDEQLVVDNDGLHGMLEKRGRIALAAGKHHQIEVRWFNKTGGAELEVRGGPLGEPLAAITDLRCAHAPP